MSDFLMGGGFEKWIGQVGVSDAPMTRSGISTALTFFHKYMPGLPERMRVNFLKAMDLSKPVRIIHLAAGEKVVAFRQSTEDPFKLFYSRSGHSVMNMGLNPNGRSFAAFTVMRGTMALESRCSPALDTWTDRRAYWQGAGGAIQLVIPSARYALELVV